MDQEPSHDSLSVHLSFIIWLDIYYDWLEFNKVKLNIILALRPPLVVLTHFFITKHSVYYKWQIKELLALWYYVLYYLLTVQDNAEDQSGLRLYWS
jgi:hypothetical protein